MSNRITPAQAQQVANTILAQLGGNRFRAMTGANGFTSSAAEGEGSLTFRIGTNDARVRGCKIILQADDTYTMKFYKWTRKDGLQDFTVCAEHEGVYVDMLQELFTKETGMYTSLGTMGA